MRKLSFLSLSIFLAINANTASAKLKLADAQPIVADVKTVAATEENKKAGFAPRDDKSVYIIQLEEPAAASYMGGVAGFAPTSPSVTGAKKLNVNSPQTIAYINFLRDRQQQTLEKAERVMGRKANVKFKYQHAFNGMAIELSPQDAKMMAGLPGVKSVTREKFERLLTDAGPQWINAPAIWGQDYYPPYLPHSRGENVVVAVLDSGVNSDHPSFADIGGDGYVHTNPLGSGNYIPGSYCETHSEFCNDKLIGAWSMVEGLSEDGVTDPTSPEDISGHGSHTSSTAVGNVLPAVIMHAPTTSLTRDISGVAPHANLIVYDVCIDSCPFSALIAAVEQVIIDASILPNGIQALNYSISGGSDPYTDPVELAFLNATAAGIYVAASAGNAGPGASTTGHNSPWVSATAALTHNRKLENSLLDFTSDEASLDNITGVGFTRGYGPAAIVYAGDFPTANGSANDTTPEQCLEPFPAGHFNGEIVVCDRGTIARTAKGDNVLAGGAGGLVLVNLEAQGEAVVGDSHSLPALHLGYSDGETLKNWLATNTNTVATISGITVNLDPANGDRMADFSSRGPNLALDILKPDIGGPGVRVMAAYETDGVRPAPEFEFLSGTSMSSPHNAGAGALVSAVRPEWSPYAIKSALMMTSKSSDNLKEDGVTATDPFDVGAGRLDLSRVMFAGLILDETPENFLAANPTTGGDPKNLNIASMQNGICVGTCSWTRKVTNVAGYSSFWQLQAQDRNGVKFSVSPNHLFLAPDETAEITVTADTALANTDWAFSELRLRQKGLGWSPDLHMPIAVKPAASTDATLLNAAADKTEARAGDILTYGFTITNGQQADVIDLSDALPHNLAFVEGSASATVVDGTTLSPFEFSAGELTWSGTLKPGSLELQASTSPFGYVPLSDHVEPFGCPASNCDDGGVTLEVPSFTYNGQTYNQVIWSVNGTLQVGSEGGQPTSATNQQLPSTTPPNNLLAPFWTDLNMGVNGDGAEWYVAVLNDGVNEYSVYEWNNIPLFGDTDNRYTFQIWVQNGTSGNIWFVYEQLGDLNPPSGVTVGVENIDGAQGTSNYFEGTGTAPAVGTDLSVVSIAGGTASFNFEAEVKRCGKRDNPIVNRVDISRNGVENSAIAITECLRGNKK